MPLLLTDQLHDSARVIKEESSRGFNDHVPESRGQIVTPLKAYPVGDKWATIGMSSGYWNCSPDGAMGLWMTCGPEWKFPGLWKTDKRSFTGVEKEDKTMTWPTRLRNWRGFVQQEEFWRGVFRRHHYSPGYIMVCPIGRKRNSSSGSHIGKGGNNTGSCGGKECKEKMSSYHACARLPCFFLVFWIYRRPRCGSLSLVG